MAWILAPGLVIWAVAYGIGMLNKEQKRDGTYRLPLWTKLVMIAVTLAFAATGWWQATGPIPTLIAVGVLAGALGDLLLADVFALERPELAAIAVFGVGHLFYSAAAILGFSGPAWTLLIVAAASTAAAVIGWRLLVFNPQGSVRLNVASLIYGIVLFITVAWAFTARISPLFAVGLLLFAASDVVLAQSLIRKRGKPALRDVVWIIYSGGQVVIALSLLTLAG